MGRTPLAVVLSRFWQWICNVAVLGGGGEGTYGARVRGCGYDVEEAHIGNIVEVDFFFENYGQSFAIQSDG